MAHRDQRPRRASSTSTPPSTATSARARDLIPRIPWRSVTRWSPTLSIFPTGIPVNRVGGDGCFVTRVTVIRRGVAAPPGRGSSGLPGHRRHMRRGHHPPPTLLKGVEGADRRVATGRRHVGAKGLEPLTSSL